MIKKYPVNISDARINCGYTLREVAAHTGISIKLLEKYEANASEMPIKIAVRLLALYQVTANSICFNGLFKYMS